MRLSVIRSSLEALMQIVDFRVKAKGFESLMKGIKVVDGGNGRCICELAVKEHVLNSFGTMHGGMAATLVDAVSTWAVMTVGESRPGVSVDLSVSYMKPALLNETLIIDATTLKIGKTLAFLSVDIRNKETNKLIAQGKHTKFVG
ncbi:hypothetical protein SNE40_012390 [Patella caerulea]|uniref:Acyl-coenzyme A thioesterase 13 n=1 Tax=Patella caerulea TaxID=87958 RepID=A0AAN8JLN0_PATCE